MLPNLSPLVAVGPSNALVRCSVCASRFQKTSPTGCQACKRKNEGGEMPSMSRQHTMGYPRMANPFSRGDEGDDEVKNGTRKASHASLGNEGDDDNDGTLEASYASLGNPRAPGYREGEMDHDEGDDDNDGTMEASYASLGNPRAPGYREEAMDYREEAMAYLREVAEFPDEHHAEVYGDASGAHFRGRIIPDQEWEQMKRDAERQVGTRPGP